MRPRDSAFMRSLAVMPIGAELLVEGPFDDLGLKRERGNPVAPPEVPEPWSPGERERELRDLTLTGCTPAGSR